MSAADCPEIDLLSNGEGLYWYGQLSSDCLVAYWQRAFMSAIDCP